MTLLAEDEDEASVPALAVDDPVYLLHERTGRVINFAVFLPECVVDRPRHAVRADEHPLAVRDPVQRLCGVHAHLFQTRDLVHIMDDLAVGVDLAALPCLLLGQIDRAAHAEAESGGFRYRNAHTFSFSA